MKTADHESDDRTAWGVDGCRAGWFYWTMPLPDAHSGSGPQCGVVADIGSLLDRVGPTDTVLIDVPIGLLESGDGVRKCDREARRLLAPHRHSSVFPAPARQAVRAPDYSAAQAANRAAFGKGLPIQSWHIAHKIREVDGWIADHPEWLGRLRETHPEVCFLGLAGQPMRHPKRRVEGFRERVDVLEGALPGAAALVADARRAHPRSGVAPDDIVDALVAAVAARWPERLVRLPDPPDKDPSGIPMEIVYLASHSADPEASFPHTPRVGVVAGTDAEWPESPEEDPA